MMRDTRKKSCGTLSGSEWQRTTPTSPPNICTRSAGLQRWAIPRVSMVSMGDSWRTPRPASYTPLSGVAPICLSCFEGVQA